MRTAATLTLFIVCIGSFLAWIWLDEPRWGWTGLVFANVTLIIAIRHSLESNYYGDIF